MTVETGTHCPYCQTAQPEGLRTDGFYRCRGCNFHIRNDWLVDPAQPWQLDARHEVLCPWCGFPVGLAAAETEPDGTIICDGCSGSLVEEMFVSQALLAKDREDGRRQRLLWLWLLVLLGFGAFVIGAVIR